MLDWNMIYPKNKLNAEVYPNLSKVSACESATY